MTARRAIIVLIKIAVTVGLLVWVLARVDLRDVGTRLAHATPGWVALAFVLGVVNVSLGAWRWQLVMAGLGIAIPGRAALRLYWSSLFFNTFLPTGVMGDALRGAWTARLTRPSGAVAGVVLDRVTALLALALVAGGSLLLPAARALPSAGMIGLGCVLLGLPAAAVVVAPGLLTRALALAAGTRIGTRVLRGSPTALDVDADADARATPASGSHRVGALALACLLHIIAMTMIAALARAAHAEVPVPVLFAVMPAVMLSSYLPVSISGIGVREAAMVELLGQAGFGASTALAISLPFWALTVALSAIGGVVHVRAGGGAR